MAEFDPLDINNIIKKPIRFDITKPATAAAPQVKRKPAPAAVPVQEVTARTTPGLIKKFTDINKRFTDRLGQSTRNTFPGASAFLKGLQGDLANDQAAGVPVASQLGKGTAIVAGNVLDSLANVTTRPVGNFFQGLLGIESGTPAPPSGAPVTPETARPAGNSVSNLPPNIVDALRSAGFEGALTQKDFPVGNVSREATGTGDITSFIRNAKGGFGTLTAAQDAFSSSPGTVSTVPGLSEQDRVRARNAFIRDKQYANAEALANTPAELSQVQEARQIQELDTASRQPLDTNQTLSNFLNQAATRRRATDELDTLRNTIAGRNTAVATSQADLNKALQVESTRGQFDLLKQQIADTAEKARAGDKNAANLLTEYFKQLTPADISQLAPIGDILQRFQSGQFENITQRDPVTTVERAFPGYLNQAVRANLNQKPANMSVQEFTQLVANQKLLEEKI